MVEAEIAATAGVSAFAFFGVAASLTGNEARMRKSRRFGKSMSHSKKVAKPMNPRPATCLSPAAILTPERPAGFSGQLGECSGGRRPPIS
jgi:hypothetical protein